MQNYFKYGKICDLIDINGYLARKKRKKIAPAALNFKEIHTYK